jgi:small GTP-binding protein
MNSNSFKPIFRFVFEQEQEHHLIYPMIFSENQNPSRMYKSLKIVFVGDGAVGKTSLIMEQYQSNSAKNAEYIPTVFDNFTKEYSFNGENIGFGLWDIGGREEYDRLRPLSYPETNFFIVCFAVDNPHSLENVKSKWNPEISHHCPDVPKLLISTKEDRRNDPEILKRLKEKEMDFVSEKEAIEMQHEIGAFGYLPTSSWSHINVEEILELCMKYLNNPKQFKQVKKNSNCELL